MNKEPSQRTSSKSFPEPRPVLVLRTDRGGNASSKSPQVSGAAAEPTIRTQTLAGTNGQPASVRFRSQTRLEYSNP